MATKSKSKSAPAVETKEYTPEAADTLASVLHGLVDVIVKLPVLAKQLSVSARVAGRVGVIGLAVATGSLSHAQFNDWRHQNQANAVQSAAVLIYQNQPGANWQGANNIQAWGNIAGAFGNNSGTAAAARAVVSVGAAVMEGNRINGGQPVMGGGGAVVYGQPVYQQGIPATNYHTYQGQTASPMVSRVVQQLDSNQRAFVDAGLGNGYNYGSNPEAQRIQILNQTGRLVAEAANLPGAYQVAFSHPFVQQVQGTKAFQEGYQRTREELNRVMQAAPGQAAISYR